MIHRKKSRMFLVIFSVLIMCFCFIQNNGTVIAKNIRLTSESLNIKNARPENIDGTVYIPLRSIFEALGWEVIWNTQSKTVTCTNNGRVINLKLGSTLVKIDDRHYIMDKPFIILGNMSYVPKKFITEEFGLKVRWNKKDNIIITSDEDTTSVTVNGGSNIIIVGDSMIVNIFEPCNIYTISDLISYADRLLASNNAQEALHKYNEILDNLSKEEIPDTYAHVMNNRANAYQKLAEYKQTKSNIQSAIGSYLEAMSYYIDIDDTTNYSIILNNLGSAYKNLYDITGNNSYLVEASVYYEKALKYYCLPKYPMDYALIQYNMGKVYYNLGMIDLSKECFMASRDVFENSVDRYSLDKDPSCYATIQFHLGIIHSVLNELLLLEGTDVQLVNNPQLQPITNFDEANAKAISHFNEALKVWTAESYPLNYAKVHKYLGDMYTKSCKYSGDLKYLLEAEKEYEEAIEFYSRERYPFLYAVANYELGSLKILLSRVPTSDEYYSEAATAYQNSLEVLNSLEYPRYYDKTLSAIEKLENRK
jgi:tetratricopeptide (TPR) repeat protein